MELVDPAAAGPLVQVVDVLGDDAFQEAGFLHPGQREVGRVGFGLAEMVVKDLLDVRPTLVAVLEEIIDVQHAWVVFAPEALRAAKAGTPLSTLMPAPVKAMVYFDFFSASTALSI